MGKVNAVVHRKKNNTKYYIDQNYLKKYDNYVLGILFRMKFNMEKFKKSQIDKKMAGNCRRVPK